MKMKIDNTGAVYKKTRRQHANLIIKLYLQIRLYNL